MLNLIQYPEEDRLWPTQNDLQKILGVPFQATGIADAGIDA